MSNRRKTKEERLEQSVKTTDHTKTRQRRKAKLELANIYSRQRQVVLRAYEAGKESS